MPGSFKTATVCLALLLVLTAGLGCEYLKSEADSENAIVTPPSVREIIDDAKKLDMKPLDLLERRRRAAHDDLKDLYQDRMDDARNDRAIDRLESQLERAGDRLDDNYDQRRRRLKARLERDKQ